MSDNLYGKETEQSWSVLNELPGHPMMWVLLLNEFIIFGLMFIAFCGARIVHPGVFAAGQAELDVVLGGINTLVLVTSGWLCALAVEARACDKSRQVRYLLAGAMVLGGVFILIKIIEYAAKVEAGHGLDGNVFFTLYFLMTGFHLMHVVAGILILGIVAWRNTLDDIRTGTVFWHMVDIIWIMMYPVFYLIR